VTKLFVFTGLYITSRCGLEYCGGAGGCRNSQAVSPNSTLIPLAAATTGSGYTYQQAWNDTSQIRSPYYPTYPDRYMTCITSMSTCWNLTTTVDCTKPNPPPPDQEEEDDDDYDYDGGF
jgi:hypothetical protein